MNHSLIEQYMSNIRDIYDKKNNIKIPLDDIKCNKFTHKYSSTKIPIYKLVIDNKEISRNNNLIVTYKCLHCFMNNKITLNLFMRKINKNITKCNLCKNLDYEKRKIQSEYMNGNKIASKEYIIEKRKEPKSLVDLINESEKLWDDYDDDFKEVYLSKYLSYEEFERIREQIVSVNNDKITNLKNYKYIFNFRSNNQTIFNPQLVNLEENLIEKPLYIKFKCVNCDNHFINRDLYIQKNKYKIMCKDCSFCNNTFKIRNMININNEKVIYQGCFEKKFIEFCNEKKIRIINGDKIKYNWNDKNLTYKIDFKIPEKKLLIELKDEHIWYKNEKKSGKMNEKIEAANKFAKSINYNYEIVFRNKYMDFITNKL
jgi:hypothetical protein